MKVVVAGASGVVGLAATRRFARDAAYTTLALSRRPPARIDPAVHCAVDLLDRSECFAFAREHSGITHVVYAALQEAPGLSPGWLDPAQIELNRAMCANLADAVAAGGSLRHVTLVQGTKAYGVHVDRNVPIPCREDQPRHDHPNFYFAQEDYLRDLQRTAGFALTILRPQIVFGESIGSPMNLIPVLGAYGAILRARGEALHYPGGERGVSEAVCADLLADVIHWAATAPAARDQTFNVANGDVFTWPDVWPAIADALGMAVGEPRPLSLEAAFASAEWQREWAAIADRHRLAAPRELAAFVGQSPIYADRLLGSAGKNAAVPALVSTIKLRQAGFSGCIDTPSMFRRWFSALQTSGVLPVA